MKWKKRLGEEAGTTIIELVTGLAVLGFVMISMFALYTSLIHSMYMTRNRAIATTLATNQMEYLKGLPYDSLAVAGGSIYATNPLPATSTQVLNGTTYKVKTSINYVDDAYDGCTNYPNQTLKERYCRNYPPPTGAPTVDTNPQDYKIVHVSVEGTTGVVFAEVDTQIAARVAETSSTTGALLVTVIDENGNPISGASVQVINTTITPNANLSDNTDSNGVAIFYGLPPDTGYDYTITVSKAGYSSLATIKPSGSLQPTYPSQNIVAQQSASVTLTIMPKGSDSLLVEAVNTSGAPLANMKIYVKGGYKRYTAITDKTYYFDNSSPDTRPTTDAGGLTALSNLTPGDYFFCGDSGATSCTIGGTTYYLVAALPYVGDNAFNPASVPRYDAANPPTTTFAYGTGNFLQKVRLVFSTSSSHPRIATLEPSALSMGTTDLTTFSFKVTGTNLPCGSTPASCSTNITFIQGANTYTASCIGSAGVLNCTVDLTGITTGFLQMRVIANGFTYITPVAPPLGGISVTP